MAISTHMMGTVSSNKYYMDDPEAEYYRRQLIEMRSELQNEMYHKYLNAEQKPVQVKPAEQNPNLTLLLCEDI